MDNNIGKQSKEKPPGGAMLFLEVAILYASFRTTQPQQIEQGAFISGYFDFLSEFLEQGRARLAGGPVLPQTRYNQLRNVRVSQGRNRNGESGVNK